VSASAEHILQELRQLPAEELRQLRIQVNKLLAEAEPCRPSRQETGRALRALYGKYEGRGLTRTLMEERARERAKERAQDEDRLAGKRERADG
jgi:hypothetical protein